MKDKLNINMLDKLAEDSRRLVIQGPYHIHLNPGDIGYEWAKKHLTKKERKLLEKK